MRNRWNGMAFLPPLPPPPNSAREHDVYEPVTRPWLPSVEAEHQSDPLPPSSRPAEPRSPLFDLPSETGWFTTPQAVPVATPALPSHVSTNLLLPEDPPRYVNPLVPLDEPEPVGPTGRDESRGRTADRGRRKWPFVAGGLALAGLLAASQSALHHESTPSTTTRPARATVATTAPAPTTKPTTAATTTVQTVPVVSTTELSTPPTTEVSTTVATQPTTAPTSTVPEKVREGQDWATRVGLYQALVVAKKQATVTRSYVGTAAALPAKQPGYTVTAGTVESTGPSVISIAESASAITMASRSESGSCIFVRDAAGGTKFATSQGACAASADAGLAWHDSW